jgi:chromate transporter
MSSPPPPGSGTVSFREALPFWARLGFINFGGPTGQIAIMYQELVERRSWIDEGQFLHALNFAMLLPGPEAHQLAIYVGWLLNGSPGAIAAGALFVLPGLVLMIVLSWVYAVHGDVAWVASIFHGLAWAVVGIVGAALVRIGGRALRTWVLVAVAAAAFLSLYVYAVPFPFVVLGAGALGILGGSRWLGAFRMPERPEDNGPAMEERVRPTWSRAARVLGAGLVVWLAPLALVVLIEGTGSVLAKEAIFFSFMALVTFGGAYAVLAYVNQAAVMRFGWLTPGEMAVGLSLAETTPGPLIIVVVFVGFLGAFRAPGSLPPALAGIMGSLVTAWATFVPSFLWIFLGAPSIERLRGNRRLAAGLSAITAAVVGVILNLAVLFAVSVLFHQVRTEEILGGHVRVPAFLTIDAVAVAAALVAFVALWRFRVSVVWIVLGAGVAGWLRFLVG